MIKTDIEKLLRFILRRISIEKIKRKPKQRRKKPILG